MRYYRSSTALVPLLYQTAERNTGGTMTGTTASDLSALFLPYAVLSVVYRCSTAWYTDREAEHRWYHARYYRCDCFLIPKR